MPTPKSQCCQCQGTLTLISASGAVFTVCPRCDWAECTKCSTPLHPLSLACDSCNHVAAAHDPRTKSGPVTD